MMPALIIALSALSYIGFACANEIYAAAVMLLYFIGTVYLRTYEFIMFGD